MRGFQGRIFSTKQKLCINYVLGPGAYELRTSQSSRSGAADIVKASSCALNLSTNFRFVFYSNSFLARIHLNTIANHWHLPFPIRNLPMVSKRMRLELSYHSNHLPEMELWVQLFTVHRQLSYVNHFLSLSHSFIKFSPIMKLLNSIMAFISENIPVNALISLGNQVPVQVNTIRTILLNLKFIISI